MKEIEAKLKLVDLEIIEKANLQKIKEIKVLDIYFDNKMLNFKAQDKVLRLRKENDKIYIAYKGPREKHENFIVREEIEPEISSFEEGMKIILNLGFEIVARVEKKRIYCKLDKLKSLSITIDTYPFIGNYIEIEGDEMEVYAFLRQQKLDISLTIKKNCTELFLEHCKEKGIDFKTPENHFTFEDEKEYNLKNK